MPAGPNQEHMRAIGAPLTLPCGVELPNRLVKGAMTECIAHAATNLPNERHSRLYQRWSKGGIGCQITGNVQVDRRYMENPRNVALEADSDLAPFEHWAAAGRAHGGKMVMQISHAGRQTPMAVNMRPVAPSAVPLELQGAGTSSLFRPPRALTGDEVLDVIERFATAAQLAERAGFDGVQLHSAHGYLLSQFLSPLVNRRDDEWGGDAERRRAVLRAVVRAVRARVAATFIVAVKLNSEDFRKGGLEASETVDVLRMLESEGVDFVEISGGTYEKPEMMNEAPRASTRAREGFFIDFAKQARAQLDSLPLMVTGGFRTAAGMAAALSDAGVDLVGIARPVAVEPDLPRELIEGSKSEALSYTLSTGSAMLDRDLRAGIENLVHQFEMRLMADGKEPVPIEQVPITRLILTGTLTGYIWDPQRTPVLSRLLGLGLAVGVGVGVWRLLS